jgi:hypothetical protein
MEGATTVLPTDNRKISIGALNKIIIFFQFLQFQNEGTEKHKITEK